MSSNGEMFVLSFVKIGRLVQNGWGTAEGYFCLSRKNNRLKLQSAPDVPLPSQFNLEMRKWSEADELLKYSPHKNDNKEYKLYYVIFLLVNNVSVDEVTS